MHGNTLQTSSADFPIDQEGRLYHLGLRPGEASNLLITVGDHSRALLIASQFDGYGSGECKLFRHLSSRGFLTLTGTYKGICISVVAIGMGYPNMDFFVREVRTVVAGPLVIIRVGTCGSIGDEGSLGKLAICTEGSAMICRNFDHFSSQLDRCNEKGIENEPYIISSICKPDQLLTEWLKKTAIEIVGKEQVVFAKNGTADSFYSSQGRSSDSFFDNNVRLMKQLQQDGFTTLEMETGMLLHLANCIKSKDEEELIKASSLQIIVADRWKDRILVDVKEREKLDILAGRIALECLCCTTISSFIRRSNVTIF